MRELLIGKNTVQDAIKNKMNIEVVYTTRPKEIKGFSKVETVDNAFLNKMTRDNHQGFVAVLKEFNYYSLDELKKDKPNKVLFLDHIQDPRNLGAIIRSANAFGIKHIVLPKDRATKVTGVTLKVASGGIVGIKIIRVNSLISALTSLKKEKYWIYATSIENGVDIEDTRFNYPMVMIIGNEEKGVSNTLLKHSDQNVFIKTTGTVQSLNASVATGIILNKI